MARVEQSVDVNVPLSTAYNQWTQFEDFPRFMDGVREVRQLDDAHLHWRAHRHGQEVEWDSEIVEQVPDQRIEWRDTTGPHHHGSISFQPISDDRTRVRMTMDFEPQIGGQASTPQEVAERLGQDLERFKSLVETQGQESGSWRGEIHGARSQPAQASRGGSPGQHGPGGSGAGAGGDGGSAAHPSGRWESWTDESAFGGSKAGETGDTTARSRRGTGQAGSAGSGQYAGRGTDPRGARGGAASGGTGSGAGGARGPQAWLRNQFPGLDEPMGMMRRMTEEMEQLFERFVGRPIASRFGQGQGGMAGKWMPQVEVVQQGDTLVVSADLPGIQREDVQVEVLHDRLTIEGERHESHESSTQEGFRRSERSYGRFYRMIPLPHGVDPDHASATMQHGVLEVRIPMPAAARAARKVNIS